MTMDEKEYAKRAIKAGMKYNGFSDARKIALGILHDVSDRSGIKHGFENLDNGVLEDILHHWEMIAQVVIDGEI